MVRWCFKNWLLSDKFFLSQEFKNESIIKGAPVENACNARQGAVKRVRNTEQPFVTEPDQERKREFQSSPLHQQSKS